MLRELVSPSAPPAEPQRRAAADNLPRVINIPARRLFSFLPVWPYVWLMHRAFGAAEAMKIRARTFGPAELPTIKPLALGLRPDLLADPV